MLYKVVLLYRSASISRTFSVVNRVGWRCTQNARLLSSFCSLLVFVNFLGVRVLYVLCFYVLIVILHVLLCCHVRRNKDTHYWTGKMHKYVSVDVRNRWCRGEAGDSASMTSYRWYWKIALRQEECMEKGGRNEKMPASGKEENYTHGNKEKSALNDST